MVRLPQLAGALKDVPPAELLKMTEGLAATLRKQIAAGHGTQADVLACNLARKEIAAFKQRNGGHHGV